MHGSAPPAGFWIRLAANILDWLLLSVVSRLLWGAEVVATGSSPLTFGLHYSNLQALLPAGYFFAFWLWRGATPGKLLLRLQITGTDGSGLTWRQVLLRMLACLPSLLFFGLGFFWIAFDSRKQGWHDKIAATVVSRR
ncbi:MAG: RDD family protein [Thermodesulfobacteriota bacterium]